MKNAIGDKMKDVEKAAFQAAGWMYSEACAMADSGDDIRKAEVTGLLERMKSDLSNHPEPVSFGDKETK